MVPLRRYVCMTGIPIWWNQNSKCTTILNGRNRGWFIIQMRSFQDALPRRDNFCDLFRSIRSLTNCCMLAVSSLIENSCLFFAVSDSLISSARIVLNFFNCGAFLVKDSKNVQLHKCAHTFSRIKVLNYSIVFFTLCFDMRSANWNHSCARLLQWMRAFRWQMHLDSIFQRIINSLALI